MSGTTPDLIEFEQGSGNVFADLGFPEPEVELAKAEISRQIACEIKARGLTQASAARLLGMDQPRVSLVVRGRTEDFSLERLLEIRDHRDLRVRSSRGSSGSPHRLNGEGAAARRWAKAPAL